MVKKQTQKQLKKTQLKKHKSKQRKVKKTKKSTTPKLKGKKKLKDLAALIKATIEKSQNISRSKLNLAAKLINLNKKEKLNTTSYSKRFQSTYTSINKNGKHSEYGQSILNESTKPFIEIKKIKNGKLTISKIVKN